eukprot:g5263.t1
MQMSGRAVGGGAAAAGGGIAGAGSAAVAGGLPLLGGIGMMAAASASASAAASDGGWDPASGGHLVMKNLMIPPDLPPGLFLPGSALVVAGLAVNAAIQLWIGGHDEFKRDEGRGRAKS